MKKFTKTLSIVLLIAMCMSMFTIGAFAAGHDSNTDTMTLVEAKAATCEAEGNIAYYSCSCGNYYTADGVYARLELADTVVAKLDHALVAVAAKDPTCAAQGNVAHSVCSNCGGYFTTSGDPCPNGASDVVLNTVLTARAPSMQPLQLPALRLALLSTSTVLSAAAASWMIPQLSSPISPLQLLTTITMKTASAPAAAIRKTHPHPSQFPVTLPSTTTLQTPSTTW